MVRRSLTGRSHHRSKARTPTSPAALAAAVRAPAEDGNARKNEDRCMKILFAVPDRDLLNAYSILLEDDGNEVEKAFDGTQVLTKLETMKFDLVIMSHDIPRIETRRIIANCNVKKVPIILLRHSKPTKEQKEDRVQPDEWLLMPFRPSELSALIKQVMSKEGRDV